MTQALAGIRVLDLTRGPAGGMATMILADFGAEVLLIEKPHSTHILDHLPATPMWRRGKQIMPLDLEDDQDLAVFHELAAGADVLVCSWRTAALARKCLDYQHMHSRHPHLVFCHITGFGSRGPMADLPGYEHTVAAYSGRMQLFAGIVPIARDRYFPPCRWVCTRARNPPRQGYWRRLLQRGENGPGRLVETSLLQGMLPYEMGGMLGRQFPERFADICRPQSKPRPRHPPMPSLFYHPAQAGDGRWMQFGNLLPHLFDNLLIAADLIDIVTDPTSTTNSSGCGQRRSMRLFARACSNAYKIDPAADWMADLSPTAVSLRPPIRAPRKPWTTPISSPTDTR